MFKRLRWSGMDAGFTAVLWRGNESQWWVPKIPFLDNSNAYATRNYHVLFKRLWLSGSRARFYNVDWRSNIGGPANYQENASNAFVVASQIVSDLTNNIPGEKVVMAHSLGNVVSEQYRRCGPGPSHSTTVNLAGIRPSAAAGLNIVRGVNFRKYPLARGESV